MAALSRSLRRLGSTLRPFARITSRSSSALSGVRRVGVCCASSPAPHASLRGERTIGPPRCSSAPRPRAADSSAPPPPLRLTDTQHIDEEDNNASTPFDFSVENWEKVHAILGRYPSNYKKSAIIPLLDLAQRQNDNHLTLAAMKKVAKVVESSDMAVYEVATFYTMFNRTPVGKYFIQLCGTTPCMVNGAEKIRSTIENHLGIHEGETTSDGLFTLREVECLGACCNAPMVQINDDFYENLDEASTVKLLDACAAGEPPVMTYYGRCVMFCSVPVA